DLPKLVLRAISYFQESSGFRDLMLGLFTADKEMFAGKYGAKIKAAAENRNLTEFIADVDLSKDIPQLQGTEKNSSVPTGGTPDEKREDKGSDNPFNKCGSITGIPETGGLTLLVL